MPRTPMHEGEIVTDPALVRRLLRSQFPHWAELPATLVSSFGTDHDIYRLGEHLAARLPRIEWATEQASKEAEWRPRLAPHLPLAVPRPMALGRPEQGYPFPWAVHEWLPGENATRGLHDLDQAAVDLARFVTALRSVATDGAPPRRPGARGGPLAEHDERVRRALAALDGRIDTAAAVRAWEQALAAPAWDGAEVWVHGDLLPGNLLVLDGRLSAVIDFGGLNVGDPACDLQAAWNLFSGNSRRIFLAEVGADQAVRLRGRGWVLAQALVALPYYWDTNPGIVGQGVNAVEQVLSDAGG